MKPTRKSKKSSHRNLTKQKQEFAVGIFWWWQERLLAETVALSHGEEFRGAINGRLDHVQVWPQFQRQFPALTDPDCVRIMKDVAAQRFVPPDVKKNKFLEKEANPSP